LRLAKSASDPSRIIAALERTRESRTNPGLLVATAISLHASACALMQDQTQQMINNMNNQ
jgi:hypothetical protein